MPLVKSGNITDDSFIHLADTAALPASGDILLSAARLLEDPDAALRRTAKVGVIWPNSRDIDDLVPYLDRLAAVALVFPTFRDGRAYSQARLIRETHGFRGTLRATGDVLRDQFHFLTRAGFDSFEVKKPADAKVFTEVLARFSVYYQPGADGRASALRRRLKSGAASEACETA